MATAKKKGSISEDDVLLLLHRYTATTILTLLREVSQFAGAKIDWRTIVKRTSTGITSAREYQMLWRHLAYREVLLEKIDDETEPSDDESDLEFELEAVPTPNDEALSEAAACVKVLMPLGSSHESASTHRTSLEALPSQNMPHEQMSRVPSDKQQLARSSRRASITGSVSIHKQSIGTPAEVLNGNGATDSLMPPKKKRKTWTKEEDMELIAAVQKCGEGNWSDILRMNFKLDRTPYQLSQRWAAIGKPQALLNQTHGNKPASLTSSEERKAAQKAFSLALDMPMTGGGTNQRSHASSAPSTTLSEAKPAFVARPLGQSEQALSQPISQKLSSTNKYRPTLRKQVDPHKVPVGANSSIQAAAFAAGGRIATPSTAASLMKAVQSKNAVHIRSPAGDSSTPLTNAKSSFSASIYGSQTPSARCIQPAASNASAQPGLTCALLNLSKHGAKQVAAVNPSTDGVAEHDTANQQTFSTTTNAASQDNMEHDNVADLLAIDVDELLTDVNEAVEEHPNSDVPNSATCEIDEKAHEGQLNCGEESVRS